MSEQEVVAKKNTGLWIPADIWEMMEIGALNAVEVMVVSYIDGLAKAHLNFYFQIRLGTEVTKAMKRL
jgi:hypothetical protein